MANQKVYQIQINGLTESISAVESLNKQLDALDKKISALSSKSVNVSGGGAKSSSTSSLSEEAKLEKQIAQLEEKRIAHSKEIYQNYLAAKDVLSETEKDQKQIAASERLAAKAYSNTIAGMKQELADIKSVMQTVDVGDTSKLNQMIDRAKVLNDKLKEIEQSYGQFGRNVGNYSSAFDGMQKLSISIGGVTREFNSAREASKTLKNELIGLEAAGSGNTEVAKELRSEYYKLQSAMDDATKSSKAMDVAMDTMQSFTAMASVGQGLKGFFGMDESEIQRSIQKLVSLQNVLQGIESIRKQMETGEGFGKLFGEGNKAVDSFVSKITGAQMTMNGLTMSSRAATLAVKGLSMAIKGIGIGLLIGAISLAVEGIGKLIKSLDTAKVKEDALEREAKALNRQYELRKDLLAGAFMRNAINNEEFLKEQYKIENEYIEKQIDLIQQRANLLNDKSIWQNTIEFFSSGENNTGFTGQKLTGKTSVGSFNQLGSFSYDVSSIEEAEEAWKKLNKAVEKGKDYWSEYGEGLGDWFNSLHTTVEETIDVMHGMGNITLSNVIGEFQDLNDKFKKGKISADDFAKGLKELTDKMNSSEVINSVIANLDEYIPDEKVREKVENILSYLGRLNDEFNSVSESQVHHWNQVRIDAMEEGAAKIAAQMAEDERHEIAQYGKTQEQISLIQAKYQRKRLDETKKHNKKVSRENKKNQKDLLEAEKDLANLRIANMKEGLNKVLKQLEEERKQRLKKVEADGILVGERQAEIKKLYDKKIEDAQREHAENVRRTYKNMWDNIYSYSFETQQKITELIENSIEIQRRDIESETAWFNQNISSYGIQGKNQLSKSSQVDLQIVSPMSDEMTADYKKLFDLQREAQTLDNEIRATKERNLRQLTEVENDYLKSKKQVEAEIAEIENKKIELEKDRIFYTDESYAEEEKKLNDQLYLLQTTLDKASIALQKADNEASGYLEDLMNRYEVAEKAAKDFEAELNQKYISEEQQQAASLVKKRLAEESYSKDIVSLYKQRSSAIEAFWQKRISFETSAATKNYEAQYELEMNSFRREFSEMNDHYSELNREVEKALSAGTIVEEQAEEIRERNRKEFQKRQEVLVQQHNNNLVKLEKDKNDKIKQINGEAYRARLQELRDFQTAISNLESKQPVQNAWGIINLKETNANNRNLLNSYKTLSEEIIKQKEKLQSQLNAKEISFDDFQNANRELDTFVENVGQKMDEVKQKLTIGDQIGVFIQSINQYVQTGLQSIQTVMQALNDYQNFEFEQEQEYLQKLNEELENKLNEQKEIVERYKDEVDSIERELADSRGDRRQHLIDQLNSEMEAQRRAYAEQKKIEKEKEKAEAKQADLDYRRKIAEWRNNKLSILVSTAMATANGLATQPFWPVGVAMGALATALGMVQYALAEKQKPQRYATGGVIEGLSHSQGGVKVLGGRAEVEGGEFITNRLTTAKNLDLLEYVNSKKKRIDISDMLEFYNGGRVKTSIQRVRTKFEDGGYIAPLPDTIDIKEQLQNVIVNQDNRPIYVSVVDINNKQADVRRVQTLAGLSE